MATQDLYEQWVERTKAENFRQGVEEGRMSALAGTYQVRFGPMPDPLQKALAQVVSSETLGRWAILVATASADEIATAIGKGQPTP